jgi:hypothetical protein
MDSERAASAEPAHQGAAYHLLEEDGPRYAFLSAAERQQLTATLAQLPLVLTGGATGRQAKQRLTRGGRWRKGSVSYAVRVT